jgi:hypothetical protein
MYLIKKIARYIFACKINKKQVFINKKQVFINKKQVFINKKFVTLIFTKPRFKTQLGIKLTKLS